LVIVSAAGNTLVQTIAEPDKRGRALSLLMMCFLGMVPIGMLLFGELARRDRVGPTWAVIAGAACCALVTARFALELAKVRQHRRAILHERANRAPKGVGLGAERPFKDRRQIAGSGVSREALKVTA